MIFLFVFTSFDLQQPMACTIFITLSEHGQRQPADHPTIHSQQRRFGTNAFWLAGTLTKKLGVCSVCSVLNEVED